MTEAVSDPEEFDDDGMRLALNLALKKAGLDLNALARQGCICCDVGEGKEIPALAFFSPKILIASEPITPFYDREKINGKLQSLQAQAKTPFELIRDEPEEVLRILTKKGIKVGLITWLNVFPQKTGLENFINFFRLARPLLITGGAAVASCGIYGIDNEDSDGGLDLMGAWRSVETLGYKIDAPDSEAEDYKSAGGIFLIGTKLP